MTVTMGKKKQEEVSWPNLLPSGPLTMNQSLRVWTIQWCLSNPKVGTKMSLAKVEAALNLYLGLLKDSKTHDTAFRAVLKQMIEEQQKPSNFPKGE